MRIVLRNVAVALWLASGIAAGQQIQIEEFRPNNQAPAASAQPASPQINSPSFTPTITSRAIPGYGAVAEGLAADAGYSYPGMDGQPVALYPRLDKVALRFESGAAPEGRDAAAALVDNTIPSRKAAAVGEPVRGRDFVKSTLSARLSLDELHASLEALSRRPGVRAASPVFVNEETGLEMALSERLIVKIASPDDLPALQRAARRAGLSAPTPMRSIDTMFVLEIPGRVATAVFAACDALRAESFVEWAEPDFVQELVRHFTPNDSLYGNQWHLNNTGQSGGVADADVDAPEAWDDAGISPGGSSGVVIAIIDTGVEVAHPDLNMYERSLEFGGTPGVDDDGNGFIDDIYGWDFYNNDNNFVGTAGHGTSCAGVAAGRGNNALGVAGAAYNSKVLAVQLFGDAGEGSLLTSWIVDSIEYAADNADVVSCSWGIGGASSSVQTAIQYAKNTRGVPVFFATGNSAGNGWQWLGLGIIPAGTHSYEWRYSKNASVSTGEDAVWIDDVVFPD